MSKQPPKPLLSRRKMPLGTGLGGTAAFTTWAWPKKWPPLVETDKAAKTSEHLFNRGLVSIDKSGWVRPEGVQDDYPVLKADISEGLSMIDALSGKTSFLKSNGDARRALKENAVSVNKEKVKEDFTITAKDLIADKYVLLQRGKKSYFLLKVA